MYCRAFIKLRLKMYGEAREDYEEVVTTCVLYLTILDEQYCYELRRC